MKYWFIIATFLLATFVGQTLVHGEEASPKSNKIDKSEREQPEDQMETLINQSAKFYENKQRAKCGGALLEVAELIQDLAQPQPQRVTAEVENFRSLAMMGARGELDPRAMDFAASNAYIRLAVIFCERAAAKISDAKPKAAGQDWYRAVMFTERGIDWGNFGLKDAGVDTLTLSKETAQLMAEAKSTDADKARGLLDDHRRMIDELGRSLSGKSGGNWEELKDTGRKATNVVEDKSRDVINKVKRGASRLGDAMRRWAP